MSRNLTAGQDTLVEANSYIVENLLEIGSVYYTTGSFDVDVSTATSGGTQTFISDNKLLTIGNIEERSYFTKSKQGFQFIGADLSTPLAFENGTRVVIYKLFRNVSTNAVEAAGAIGVFDGYISSKRLDFDGSNQILQIECSADNVSSYKSLATPLLSNNITGGTA